MAGRAPVMVCAIGRSASGFVRAEIIEMPGGCFKLAAARFAAGRRH